MNGHNSSGGCCDWRFTRGQLTGGGSKLIPVPADALDGLEHFAKNDGFTRRDVLERGVGLWVAASMLGGLTTRGLMEAAAAQAADDPNATILVSLFLDGGNDGLNTLVPLADPLYPQLRSRVGIDPATTLPLSGVSEFGWHPSLTGLQTLYDQGKVAVLPAVDYAKPDLSHFNSSAFWRTGIAEPSRITTGWLGRALDTLGGLDNPLQGINVNYAADPILNSQRAPTATVYNPNEFEFSVQGVWDEEKLPRAHRAAAAAPTRSRALKAVRANYRSAYSIQDRLAPLRVDDEAQIPPPPVAYPDTGTGTALRNLARMLGAGFGTRVASVTADGGYDTHDNQPGEHATLLKDLGDSLLAWQADLEARALSSRVLTLVWTEFGRRPEDNESNGTDHGAGGLLLVVGDRANGGIRSEFPGLAQLDRDDNLLVTTEFRTVYASLLEGWLGIEAGRVLPNMDASRLPLVAAA